MDYANKFISINADSHDTILYLRRIFFLRITMLSKRQLYFKKQYNKAFKNKIENLNNTS